MLASVWTRKDIQSFKDSVKHCQENVIKIGSLATATVSSLYNFDWCLTCMGLLNLQVFRASYKQSLSQLKRLLYLEQTSFHVYIKVNVITGNYRVNQL